VPQRTVVHPDIEIRKKDENVRSNPASYQQHDRLVAAMAGMKGRIPISVSGDLHAIGIGKILRAGNLSLEANPLTAALSGPLGNKARRMAFRTPRFRRLSCGLSGSARGNQTHRAAHLRE